MKPTGRKKWPTVIGTFLFLLSDFQSDTIRIDNYKQITKTTTKGY